MRNIIYLVLIFTLGVSCGSKKNIIYLQDSPKNLTEYSFTEYKLKIDDILKIDINLNNPDRLLQETTLNGQAAYTNTKESMTLLGHQVDFNGNINVPYIGELYVKNLSINQLRNIISNKLIENKILVNPVIDIKLLNAHFTVLGEVNRPGRYEFLKNNITILEAIGMSGDLTINGKRKDVKLIRTTNSGTNIINLDLTSTSVLNKNFQLFSGDIIIVNPNTTRVKNAGLIGNSGTLLSLLSFILSTIIITTN